MISLQHLLIAEPESNQLTAPYCMDAAINPEAGGLPLQDTDHSNTKVESRKSWCSNDVLRWQLNLVQEPKKLLLAVDVVTTEASHPIDEPILYRLLRGEVLWAVDVLL